MLFVQKGYCRFCGSKCRHLKVEDGVGYCKKRTKQRLWRGKAYIRNEKTRKPKNISADPNVNIKAPSWCPKF